VRERSAQRFILRDATGEVTIDPVRAVIRTRHVRSRFGTGAFVSSRRESERLLLDGEEACVVGQLSFVRTPSGTVERRVHVPENGRRFLISSCTEAQLIVQERLWAWGGLVVGTLAVVTLAWGYVQRYEVRSILGALQ
jgi:hypothetical protein